MVPRRASNRKIEAADGRERLRQSAYDEDKDSHSLPFTFVERVWVVQQHQLCWVLGVSDPAGFLGVGPEPSLD